VGEAEGEGVGKGVVNDKKCERAHTSVCEQDQVY
jgi:hypothetical protein